MGSPPGGTPESDGSERRKQAKAYQGAMEAVIAVIVAALIGYWIDGRMDSSPWGLIAGVVMLPVAGLYGIRGASTVTAAKITDTHAFIKGVGEEYLAELPVWQG